MEIKKFFLSMFILLFSIGFVYSLDIRYSGFDNKQFEVESYYCNPNDSSCSGIGQILENSNGLVSTYELLNIDNTDSYVKIHKLFNFYCPDSRVLQGMIDNSGTGHYKYSIFETMCLKYLTPSFYESLGGKFRYKYETSEGNGEIILTVNWDNKDLQENICSINSVDLVGNQLSVLSSLNPISKITSGSYAIPESLKEDYYYMKAFVFLKLYDSSGGDYSEIIVLPKKSSLHKDKNGKVKLYQYDNKENANIKSQFKNLIDDPDANKDYIYINGELLGNYEDYFTNFETTYLDLNSNNNNEKASSAEEVPYVLLKPEAINVEFDLDGLKFQLQNLGLNKNYQVQAYVIPIDGKCDFDQDKKVSPSEGLFLQQPLTEPIIIENSGPIIQLTAAHSNLLTGSTALQSYLHLDIQNAESCKLNGEIISPNLKSHPVSLSSSELEKTYTLVCKGNNETEAKSIMFKRDTDGDGYADIDGDNCLLPNKKVNGEWDNPCYFNVPDYYKLKCLFKNDGKYKVNRTEGGTININAQTISSNCGACEGLDIYVNGKLKDYDSCPNPTFGSNKECNVFYDFSAETSQKITIDIVTKDDDDPNRHMISVLEKECTNYNQEDDGTTLNKLACGDDCVFSQTGEVIELPTTNVNNIKIYKNNTLIREEKVNPKTIALKGHKIKKFKSKEQAEQFVNSSVRLMEKFEIEKYLTYNQATDTTKVEIKLNNIPTSEQKDITLYQVIPKDFANKLNEIKQLNNGNGQFIVLDKDPVIGWHFEDSNENEAIEYELPGENEGGTIIITQEPILFNEGELIINYRETQCNSGELKLFELSDLENSQILTSGGIYKVCLAHLDDSVTLELNSNNNAIHLFNHSGNFSLTQYSNSLDISTNNDDIYWNVQFQETNPDGTFSCLGSYNNKVSSTFGDCGYNPQNRIWIHLGQDLEAPKTKLSYPYLAHKMKVKLEAEDLGSGVDKTYYCISNAPDQDCTPDKISTGEDIFLECPNKWGCVRRIKFYSTDKAGNIEDLHDEKITLIEQGSACQADCTAKPTPNRIIKDCMNLNGCTFFGDTEEKQKQVAQNCHYLTAGTWVEYNESHEIICPNGPLRETQFTKTPLKFWDSVCDNIQTTKYPVLVNGQQVNMVFVYCEEY